MRRREGGSISMEAAALFILLFSSLHIHKIYAFEFDSISQAQFLTDGDTLVSPARVFELGFFRPGSSENRYLGIWYKKSVGTVVWVANRDLPIVGASSAALRIVPPGILILVNSANDTVWSSNTTTPSRNATAQLLDTGNLVVKDENIENFLWQSFDYPTDTLLPGMKFGRDILMSKEWYLSSWTSDQDPAPGKFTWSVDKRGYPQNILKEGTGVKFRGGPWNGVGFSGATGINKNMIFTYNMVMNEQEVLFTYNVVNRSFMSRLTLNSSGVVQRWGWVEEGKMWQLTFTLPKDICDTYNMCGAYGSCSMVNAKRCTCLDNTKFVPRNEKGWETADWLGGCMRRTPLDCKNRTDGFIRYSNIKLPDTQSSWFNRSMTQKECEAKCLNNCTCTAYANTDIRGQGSGCLVWFGDLIDIILLPEGNGGQDIFVRMAFSELVVDQSVSRKKGRAKIKIILPVLLLGILLIGFSSTWFWYARRKRNIQERPLAEGESSHVSESQAAEAMELPLISFSTIAKATASFSPYNKLGEGGFGPVYKGMLEEGQEVAVKRLSRTSSQGLDEFKNEVICVSKLQHRNLVKLLGCCILGYEKLLIYEYMPNRSLDLHIFDKTRSMLLDWTRRFDIIKGIARGLLYLHQDSRLRIIHRDLKASNILLDVEMTPKISDFGIARSFGGNETEANTERVVGTYGYMSPEYALDGLFSIKSDVFSFGVLVLEIVSGKRNRGFVRPGDEYNLIGHAWRMHKAGRSMELVDESLGESYHPSEVVRSINVGLLCVQQSPEDRPNMSSVILMLGSDGALPVPKQPAFFMGRNLVAGDDYSSSSYRGSSTTELTFTDIVAR